MQTFPNRSFYLCMRMNCRKEVGEVKDGEKVQLCECICSLSIRSRCWSRTWPQCWEQGKQTGGRLALCLHMLFPPTLQRLLSDSQTKTREQANFLQEQGGQPQGCFYWQISKYLILASCAQYDCSQMTGDQVAWAGWLLILTNINRYPYNTHCWWTHKKGSSSGA